MAPGHVAGNGYRPSVTADGMYLIIFAYQDGHVQPPRGPGLGITINEEAVRRAAAVGHAWRNPVWRTDDGAIAEW